MRGRRDRGGTEKEEGERVCNSTKQVCLETMLENANLGIDTRNRSFFGLLAPK